MGSIQNVLNGTLLRVQNADLLLKEVSSSKVLFKSHLICFDKRDSRDILYFLLSADFIKAPSTHKRKRREGRGDGKPQL